MKNNVIELFKTKKSPCEDACEYLVKKSEDSIIKGICCIVIGEDGYSLHILNFGDTHARELLWAAEHLKRFAMGDGE